MTADIRKLMDAAADAVNHSRGWGAAFAPISDRKPPGEVAEVRHQRAENVKQFAKRAEKQLPLFD